MPLNIRFGFFSKCLKVKSIASVLDGLSLISHWFALDINIRRSWLIMLSMSCMLAAEQNRELSFANDLVKLSNRSEISSTNIRENIGPRIDP